MKAVIYARYSSDSQREESIEGQIRECTEYAQRSNITILTSYIDRALSARTADRPEFQRMIRDSEKGLFDTVLVWKLDRFSRDRYDSAHYKHILKKNGVKVISAKENISDGPEGIILESMLEGYAEYYSAELSQKIQRGQKENAMKCKNNGGNTPLGYCVDKESGVLAVNPLTAPIVQEIFSRYDSGERMCDIRDSLNDRGLKAARGHAFNVGGISLILKNRKYIGEYKYSNVVIPDGIPAIIEKDLFERVQLRMEANRKAPARAKADEEYLLTTKLFCGTCGRLMAGESGTSSTKGIKYRYYKCSGAKRHLGCKRKPLRKDWIERVAVLLTINKVLTDSTIGRIADAIVAMQNEEDTMIPALEHQLRECEKGISNLLNAIQAGILTASTKERLEQLENQRDELKCSILQAQMERPKYSKEEIIQWISRYKYGNIDDKDYQKEIIDTFLNSVYVYDDRLVFTYNYKDGTETLTLKDIEAAFGSDLTQVAPPQLRNPNFVPFGTAFGFLFLDLLRDAGSFPLLWICQIRDLAVIHRTPHSDLVPTNQSVSCIRKFRHGDAGNEGKPIAFQILCRKDAAFGDHDACTLALAYILSKQIFPLLIPFEGDDPHAAALMEVPYLVTVDLMETRYFARIQQIVDASRQMPVILRWLRRICLGKGSAFHMPFKMICFPQDLRSSPHRIYPPACSNLFCFLI